MKVRVIYDAPEWAYHHRARMLQEYAPPDIQISIAPINQRFADDDCDLLFDMNYGHVAQVRAELAKRKHRALFVTSFNNGYPNRMDYLALAKSHAHAVIINNRDCFEKTGAVAGTYHISNGVDRRVFACRTPIADRPARMISIGSYYHRKLKGADDLLRPLAVRLQGRVDADFRVIDPYLANNGPGSGGGDKPLTHAELADWYNGASVYVVASLCEGTPNPALEAASCGCVLVTTRVGNMPELVRDQENGIFVERTIAGIEAGVIEALERRRVLSEQMQEDIASWDWSTRAREFYKLFRALVSGEAPLLRARGTA